MESPSSGEILPLKRPDRSRLRSAVVIPTFPQILNELVQNALDAGAARIDCWINLEKGNETIRVEDDGYGLDKDGLNQIGRVSVSSKDRTDGHNGPTETYGFRGEALASISAVGLLEITSKTARSRNTHTKVLKNGRPVFTGSSNRPIIGSHGTTVIVKDIFHNIPVRYISFSNTPATTTLAACRKIIETLALVRPNVKWALWEDKPSVGNATSGPKKIISVKGGKTSADVYRNIYGNALTERVQSIRVSSEGRRVEGFISLHGAISQSSQHLYVNHFPLDRSDIHAAIAKRFAGSRFSRMTQDDIETPDFSFGQKRSPRRLERYPIYVLNVTLPSEDVDVAYDPKKRILGHRDIDTVKSFVLAVVDQFLKRHGFVSKQQEGALTEARSPLRRVSRASAAPSNSTPSIRSSTYPDADGFPRSSLNQPIRPEDSALVPTKSKQQRASVRPESSRPHTPSTMAPPQLVPHKRSARALPDDDQHRMITPDRRNKYQDSGLAGDELSRSRFTIESSGKRHQWIDDIVKGLNTGVMPFSPAESNLPTPFLDRIRKAGQDAATTNEAQHHTCHHSAYNPTSEVTFSIESLANTTVLGQVDTKFIACLLESPGKDRTLVLIDQHAADERVSVEEILHELCIGFVNNRIHQTEVSGPNIVLTLLEAQRLAIPGYLEIFARWGISLDLPTEIIHGDYVQVPILAVPTLLASRLARKEASEMTRLVRLHLDQLDEDYNEIHSFLDRVKEMNAEKEDWQKLQRWMPKEMLELANSKACRNAIMFQDPLDLDQCRRLVHRLSKARSPWICAHGRPSMVPLGLMGQTGGMAERVIDWTAWRPIT